jgi:hypothetical protein
VCVRVYVSTLYFIFVYFCLSLCNHVFLRLCLSVTLSFCYSVFLVRSS